MLPGSQQVRSHGRSVLLRLVLMLAVACGVGGRAAASTLIVVSDPESPFHQAIVDRVAGQFDALRGGDGRALVQVLDEAQFADRPPAETDQTLVITVGARAAASVATRSPAAATLNVFLPLATYRHLSAGSVRPSAAIVLDQPVERQLAVARLLLPHARRAAMLGSAEPTDPGTPYPAREKNFGFEVSTTLVEGDAAPLDVIRDVLRNGDLVIVTFDPQVYTPVMAKWLLYLASQQQKPLIGFSRALLEAGALASVFSTPEQIARQTIELVDAWLKDAQAPAVVAYPRHYHVGVNSRVARQLGIEAPDPSELELGVRRLLEEAQ
jgi:hypothetical protein